MKVKKSTNETKSLSKRNESRSLLDRACDYLASKYIKPVQLKRKH